MSEKLREALAELEHEQWMSWAESLIQNEDLSAERLHRWSGFFKPYDELPEDAKESDRKWADKVIAAVDKYIEESSNPIWIRNE